MNVCNLPISLLSLSGEVRVLLTAVGVKIPAAFENLRVVIKQLTQSLELDVQSVAPEYLPIKGQVSFSLSICESADALPFLLGLSDPYSPHLDFHVVVGAAVAESQKELVECAYAFERMVQSSISQDAIPCLFVYSPKSFDGASLPPCATQLPSDSSPQDISRRVREGFVKSVMDYIFALGSKCDHLDGIIDSSKKKDANKVSGKGPKLDRPQACVTLASYAFLFGGNEIASDLYNQGSKLKGSPVALAITGYSALNPRLKIDIDTSNAEKDFPIPLLPLKDDPDFGMDKMAAIAFAAKCYPNRAVLIRTCLQIAARFPKFARTLLLYAIPLARESNAVQFLYYHQLALLLLKQSGNERTFMFYTSNFIKDYNKYPSYIMKPFVQSLIQGSDWCEQRVRPAATLFASAKVPRDIKNTLIQYLLTYLPRISREETQSRILKLIPSNMEIDANLIVEVRYFEPIQALSPIEKSLSRRSNVFIYSPLNKRKKETICSVGEELSFEITLYNPLNIALTFDTIELIAENAYTYPVVAALRPKKDSTVSVHVKPMKVGGLKIMGFKFVTGNLTGVYNLKNEIVYEIIDQLPSLTMAQPMKLNDKVYENSHIKVDFQLINTSDVPVDIKGIIFSPVPPVLTPTSLPLNYPPIVSPPLPSSLEPSASHSFSISFVADQTVKALSYAIEYGPEGYSRRFEYHQDLEIVPGPHISEIQVIPFLNHDDFDTKSVTLMIVTSNPFDSPIKVMDKSNENPTIIEANSLGTFMIDVDRIDINIDRSGSQKFQLEGFDGEHVRKCETTAVKEKQRELTIDEKKVLWSTLHLKKQIQDQLQFTWTGKDGLSGDLPFTHINIPSETLMLLQPPPFSVKYELTKRADQVWDLNCSLESDTEINVKIIFEFSVVNDSEGENYVLSSGNEETNVTTPTSFTTSLNAAPRGSLEVTGSFYIGETDAFFIRKGLFQLA